MQKFSQSGTELLTKASNLELRDAQKSRPPWMAA
jgi:hypothetical protein